jgi:hypothetical protein
MLRVVGAGLPGRQRTRCVTPFLVSPVDRATRCSMSTSTPSTSRFGRPPLTADPRTGGSSSADTLRRSTGRRPRSGADLSEAFSECSDPAVDENRWCCLVAQRRRDDHGGLRNPDHPEDWRRLDTDLWHRTLGSGWDNPADNADAYDRWVADVRRDAPHAVARMGTRARAGGRSAMRSERRFRMSRFRTPTPAQRGRSATDVASPSSRRSAETRTNRPPMTFTRAQRPDCPHPG